LRSRKFIKIVETISVQFQSERSEKRCSCFGLVLRKVKLSQQCSRQGPPPTNSWQVLVFCMSKPELPLSTQLRNAASHSFHSENNHRISLSILLSAVTVRLATSQKPVAVLTSPPFIQFPDHHSLQTRKSIFPIPSIPIMSSVLKFLRRKRYQYEVTFSLYMLTPTEKIVFSKYHLWYPPHSIAPNFNCRYHSPLHPFYGHVRHFAVSSESLQGCWIEAMVLCGR